MWFCTSLIILVLSDLAWHDTTVHTSPCHQRTLAFTTAIYRHDRRSTDKLATVPSGVLEAMGFLECFLILVAGLTLAFREIVAWIFKKPANQMTTTGTQTETFESQTLVQSPGPSSAPSSTLRRFEGMPDFHVASSYGTCYHLSGCRHLRNRRVSSYRPCSTCLGWCLGSWDKPRENANPNGIGSSTMVSSGKSSVVWLLLEA